MEQVKDKNVTNDQMLIVEKYERVISYLYPIVQRTARKDAVVRDKMLSCLFDGANLFFQAGKSNQIGKLYAADANLALLRFYVRFYKENIRQLTTKQETHALALIGEVGNLLGSWIGRKKG